eukprot:scaffold60751_cov36-Cyclotella_meneghiniana.AAC.3
MEPAYQLPERTMIPFITLVLMIWEQIKAIKRIRQHKNGNHTSIYKVYFRISAEYDWIRRWKRRPLTRRIRMLCR